MDESSTEGPARLPSQTKIPRSRPRIQPSTQPSGMWFCPMPRCARLEGASPTGWGCLQSLVSLLRSVHLSTGAVPPDACRDAHGLRVCLACRELSSQWVLYPGPRCSTAVLALLALDNNPPLQHKHTRHWQGPSRRAWTSYTFRGLASLRCAGSSSRTPPRAPGTDLPNFPLTIPTHPW